jgi:hypothetical protein
MSKPFRTYLPEQDLLLPPSLRDWLGLNDSSVSAIQGVHFLFWDGLVRGKGLEDASRQWGIKALRRWKQKPLWFRQIFRQNGRFGSETS